jgi:hypothetical protein
VGELVNRERNQQDDSGRDQALDVELHGNLGGETTWRLS